MGVVINGSNPVGDGRLCLCSPNSISQDWICKRQFQELVPPFVPFFPSIIVVLFFGGNFQHMHYNLCASASQWGRVGKQQGERPWRVTTTADVSSLASLPDFLLLLCAQLDVQGA